MGNITGVIGDDERRKILKNTNVGKLLDAAATLWEDAQKYQEIMELQQNHEKYKRIIIRLQQLGFEVEDKNCFSVTYPDGRKSFWSG